MSQFKLERDNVHKKLNVDIDSNDHFPSVNINPNKNTDDFFLNNPDDDNYSDSNKDDLGINLISKDSDSDQFNRRSKSNSSLNSDNNSISNNSNGAYDNDLYENPVYNEKSFEEIQKEKIFYLTRLDTWREQGGSNIRHLSMDADLQVIKGEYYKVQKKIEMNRSISFCRTGLLFCTQALEGVNQTFNPYMDLDGWSTSVYTDISKTTYDDVLLELYEKWTPSGVMSPELKLMFMLGGSALTYNLQRKALGITSSGNSSNNIITNILGSMFNKGGNTNVEHNKNNQYREMRGPNISTEDLLNHLNDDRFENDSNTGSMLSNDSSVIICDEFPKEKEEVKTIPVKSKKRVGRPKKNNK